MGFYNQLNLGKEMTEKQQTIVWSDQIGALFCRLL